jgi:hypothetical protein
MNESACRTWIAAARRFQWRIAIPKCDLLSGILSGATRVAVMRMKNFSETFCWRPDRNAEDVNQARAVAQRLGYSGLKAGFCGVVSTDW